MQGGRSHSLEIFYAPGSNDRGHMFLSVCLFVCLSVCLFVCLCVVNFNLRYNFWTFRGRDFILYLACIPSGFPQSLNFGFSLKSPWKWICPWKVLEFRGPSLKFQLVVLDFLFCVFLTESLDGYSKLRGTRANFSQKNSARFARSSLQVKYFFQFLLLIYNSRTIVIISFLSQEYLQVFMYIMCFNVSICFKMGSLYSYCDIITS